MEAVRRRVGRESEGSRFKPWCGQYLQGVLVAGGGARTPLECHRGTLEQGAESAKAHTL